VQDESAREREHGWVGRHERRRQVGGESRQVGGERASEEYLAHTIELMPSGACEREIIGECKMITCGTNRVASRRQGNN
jgi:hypothetical protein